MNGSNSMDESDRQPIHLCPTCLRKLAHALGFDVIDRYRELAAFYGREAFDDETEWLKTRLSRLGAGEDGRTVRGGGSEP
jgi:archaemetzincin